MGIIQSYAEQSSRAFQSFVLQIRSQLSIQATLAALMAEFLTDNC